jgi:putative transposase
MDNKKRVHRIYKEEGLNLRSKRPRRNKAAAHSLERPGLDRMYQCCSMDFVADQLFDGRKFWALTLVDNFSRQCMARLGTNFANICLRLYEENWILVVWALGRPSGI